MHYALPAKKQYPIETEEQLKTAAFYFGRYLNNFHPAERVAAATSLEKRASELGMVIDDSWILNYSHKDKGYSPDFDLHMEMRKEACAGHKIKFADKMIDASELLQKVASKKDVVTAQEMVNLISEFDKKAGIENQYDHRIRDPFFTVYGSSTNPKYGMEKVANDMYAYELKKMAGKKAFITKLAQAFGNDFAKSFQNNPVDIYKSMPNPEKSLIKGMAEDNDED